MNGARTFLLKARYGKSCCPFGSNCNFLHFYIHSKEGGLRPPSISPCGARVLAPGCRGPSAPFSQSLWYTYKATIYSSSCILVIKREIQDMAEGGTNRPLEMTTQGVGEGERLSCSQNVQLSINIQGVTFTRGH